ncbi:sodium ion-translocating decarboxylase subunit beta [Zongyangia hominis]|uniref:Uncharacterized protein n=1 Tax=Zongyangia hominis TaxID=2763677 RepID=A0A926IAU5_9FIRM|nr:sodium ion-translocating decarboxylase subunit beta [Zongyangia hominis]MBC8569477.1 hypothetical protein [Zongyangia hominis]
MKEKIPMEDKGLLFASICGFLTAGLSKRHVFGKENKLGHVGIIGGEDGPTAIYVANKSGDETVSNSYVLPLGVSKRKLKEMLGNFFSFNAIAAVLRCLCLVGLLLSSVSILSKLGKD